MNYTRMFLTMILLLCCNVISFAQQMKYSRAKILLDSKGHGMMDLSKLGLAVDHGDYKPGSYFISDFSEMEIKQAENAGFKVEILIDDVVKHYREQNNPQQAKPQKKTTAVTCDTVGKVKIDVPKQFQMGTYGGHFTYTEMEQLKRFVRSLRLR